MADISRLSLVQLYEYKEWLKVGLKELLSEPVSPQREALATWHRSEIRTVQYWIDEEEHRNARRAMEFKARAFINPEPVPPVKAKNPHPVRQFLKDLGYFFRDVFKGTFG